jgi:hypothetical protein
MHPLTHTTRAMRTAKLNIFQRLVRQWDAFHPYNAAQVLRIDGQPDTDAWRGAWHEALDALGLGVVHIRDSTLRHECLNGHAQTHTVRVLEDGTLLEAHLSSELNTPFASDPIVPFRPFILRENGSFYAGVVYQHWIADSASIRNLMREWFVRVFDPKAAHQKPVRIARGGYWRYFGPQRANWELSGGVLSSLRWSHRFSQARRIHRNRVIDPTIAFSLHRMPAGTITQLRDVARSAKVKLNDLFLAAIAQACDAYVPLHRVYRRDDVALGTIVDLRARVRDPELRDAFGLFLGFTSVICRPDELADWNILVHSIAAQNERNRHSGAAAASLLRMIWGVAAGKFMKPEKLFNLYRQRVPLAGGISNIDLTPTWASAYHPRPLMEYVRVSPTGPMMPLVFTTSTLGNTFHFGLTRRICTIPDDDARRIAQSFIDRLTQCASNAD